MERISKGIFALSSLTRFNMLKSFISISLLLIVASACCPPICLPPDQTWDEWTADGGVIYLLCEETNLRECHFANTISVRSNSGEGIARISPVALGLEVRSMAVLCNVPLAVSVYEGWAFNGVVGIHHCHPGRMLEIDSLQGTVTSTTGTVIDFEPTLIRGIILTHDYYATEPDPEISNDPARLFEDPFYTHTGIDFSEYVNEFGNGLRDQFASGLRFAELHAATISWNSRIGPNWLPPQDWDTEYLNFDALLRIGINDWPYPYWIAIGWTVEPSLTVRGRRGRLTFTQPFGSQVWVEGGVLHDSIFNTLVDASASFSDGLTANIEDSFRQRGGQLAIDTYLRNIDHIRWSFKEPRPCVYPIPWATLEMIPCARHDIDANQAPPVMILRRYER